MVKSKKKKNEIWWLAHGHSTQSRQPSFAPPTARPSVTYSSYGFGWHREKSCFVTSRSHGFLSGSLMTDYPCDPEIAHSILRRCVYKNVLKRFFANSYSSEDDCDIYSAKDYLFGISLSRFRRNVPSEACLYFYSPEGKVQCVSFHNGMTSSFGQNIANMRSADILKCMQ